MNEFIGHVIYLFLKGLYLVIPLILIFTVILIVIKKKNNHLPWSKIIIFLMFTGWFGITISATLLRVEFAYRQYNFHLFMAWREAWNKFTIQVWLNILLNIALFIPLGVLLPLMFKKFRKWYIAFCGGFLFSLIIEIIQIITLKGMFDVDDIFNNTLGAVLGWCIVMIIITIVQRNTDWKKHCLMFLSVPMVSVLIISFIFISYFNKPYGNIPDDYVVRANLDNVNWDLKCTLSDTSDVAPVYEVGRLNKEDSELFANNFSKKLGIEFLDTYYYDDLIIFANHSTGDFLHINQNDGTWKYDLGRSISPVFNTAVSDINSNEILDILFNWNINVPKESIVSLESTGENFNKIEFKADMIPIGDKFINGTLICNFKSDNGKTEIDSIDNFMVTLLPCKEESILSPKEAVNKMYDGYSFEGFILENNNITEINIISCNLEWISDTKGFYQPVYCFELETSEQEIFKDYVKAIK